MRTIPLKFLEKAYFITFLAVAITLPTNAIAANSAAIIGLTVVWLLEPEWKAKFRTFQHNAPYGWIMVGFFLLHVLGLLYTEDFRAGNFEIEKKLSFLIFPLVVFSTRVRPPSAWIYAGFVASLSMTVLWDLADVVLNPTVMQAYQLDGAPNYRLAIVEYHQVHATYKSLHAFLSILGSIWLWQRYPNSYLRGLLAIAMMLAAGTLLLLASRIVLLSIALTSIVYLIGYTRGKARAMGLVALGSSMLVMAALVWYIPSSRARFTEMFTTPFVPPTGGVHNSTSLRAAHLFCDRELASQHYLVGVGPGDVQDQLDACYQSHHFSDFLYTGNRHNCHNQYFQTLIGLGIAGLFMLLLLFFLPFVHPRNKLDFVVIYFLGSYICTGFTESVFEMQKGIVLFAFFYTLLLRVEQAEINHE